MVFVLPLLIFSVMPCYSMKHLSPLSDASKFFSLNFFTKLSAFFLIFVLVNSMFKAFASQTHFDLM